MTASYVTLILDASDATGTRVADGRAVIVPSLTQLPDPADEMLVWPVPVTRSFGGGQPPQVRLAASDTIGPQQGSGSPGWTYNISFPGVPGPPAPFSFYLLSTGGSPQYLSALAQVPVAQPGQQYVPLPPGSAPSPGDTLTVVGTGPLVTEWLPGNGIDGGSAASGLYPAGSIDGGSA